MSVRRLLCLVTTLALIPCPAAIADPMDAPWPGEEDLDEVRPFDWDLVSLEQNNPRFNASVLSGLHSVRSPGVTPHRAWKAGLGALYSREELVAVASNTVLFDREQLLLNPKLNYGLLSTVEVGAAFEGTWTEGEEIQSLGGGQILEVSDGDWEASAIGLGIKWQFLDRRRLRLALSFDSRVAINRGAFGSLPGTLYNVELDGDYALTTRFSLAANLQFMTSDLSRIQDQVVVDLAGLYSFTNRFRGMLFATAIEDDEADDVLFFLGVAGQYVYEQHSITLALDFQLNDAARDVRTQRQLDVELSYTFTF